jgi:polyribonucleotide nucleotidyltransferase
VVKTTTFGAFVSLLPGKDGLLHITQIRKLHGGKRIENIDDVVHIGDKIQVEIREIDDRGKLSLVPVEVIEREAAGEDLGGGDDNGDRPRRDSSHDRGPRGERGNRGEGSDSRGENNRGEHSRTRHRSRGGQGHHE